MGGGGTETTTTSSAPSNPDVNPTLSKVLTGVQGQVDSGYKVFDKSLNPGAGATTQNAWGSMLSASKNPDYANGIAGATSDFADIAAGNRFGTNDPGYSAMRQGALDDAMTGVGSSFLTDGRFGSSVMGDAAGKAATQTLAGLDYQNFQNDQSRQLSAAQMLPGLYSAGMAPAGVEANIGAQQDANALALTQAENDLFRRRHDAGWMPLNNASAVLAGTAGQGGQTQSTTTPTAPWWQQAIGYVAGNAGKAVGMM